MSHHNLAMSEHAVKWNGDFKGPKLMLGHKSGQSRDILDNRLKRDDFVTVPHQVKDGKF